MKGADRGANQLDSEAFLILPAGDFFVNALAYVRCFQRFFFPTAVLFAVTGIQLAYARSRPTTGSGARLDFPVNSAYTTEFLDGREEHAVRRDFRGIGN